MKASVLFFATTIIASPVYYDLDHDGVPDWCPTTAANGMVSCLERESTGLVWTSFMPSTTAAPSSTIAAISSASVAPFLTSSTTSSFEPAAATLAADNAATAAVSAALSLPSAAMPLALDFAAQNGTQWHVSRVGTIFSSTVPSMGWDNGRTSVLDNKLFWNFGDVQSNLGLQNGFSTGPAFYGNPDNMLEVDMANITDVTNLLLAAPYASDPVPEDPTPFWGLSTGNVAEVSPGVGIGFVWEIWRNTSTPIGDVNRGLGIYKATLGEDLPIGNRTGPLVAGPDAIQVGIMTIMAAEGYIYTYTNGGPSGIIVGRAVTADAFDIDAYEFLKLDGTWVKGVPLASDTTYGVTGNGTLNSIGVRTGEVIHSDGQGSIMFNNYFNKYMIFTGAYESAMMFYVSDTPYGPWSSQYVIEDILGYGINVHPFFSPNGSGKTIYLSSGVNNIISMFKIDFDYGDE